MLRVTVLGVALAISVAACTNRERGSNADTAAGGGPAAGTESAAAPAGADTMGGMAPGSTATTSAGGAIDTMAKKAGAAMDTMGQKAGQAANKAKAAAGAGAAKLGGAASSAELNTKLASLSRDEVKQLQTALNREGCNVGTPDGVVGPRTRQGVECALRKHNIPGANVDSLYKVLNLNIR